MLKIELACQEFTRETGNDGKIVWPIDITEEQLTEVMSIPAVFTPNTRAVDQLEGTAVWAIRDKLMLVTLLKSWQSQEAWTGLLLACFASDKGLTRDWELRMTWTEDLDEVAQSEGEETLELTNAICLPGPCVKSQAALLPGKPLDKQAIRENRKNHALAQRLFRRVHDPDSFFAEEDFGRGADLKPLDLDFDKDDLDGFVANFGQEDQLW